MTRYKKSKLKNKLFFGIGLSLVIGLFCCFFGQFNGLVSLNYEIKNCETEIKQLSAVNEDLKMNFVEANRISQIENIAQNLNFEKTEKVHYIKVISGVVASK